jgi:DNA-binding MarR family transcriptional regulator
MTKLPPLSDRDYRILASVRAELRSFAHFTEEATSQVGLTAQQHQILLALRAAEDGALTVGELAETMFLKPHSVSGMADRLEAAGLLERVRGDQDRRRITLRPTPAARDLLASLGQAHRSELKRIRPLLISLLSQLE